MFWVKETGNVPIKSWCLYVESGAYAQALNVANLPFAFRHVALMPDCHQGYGMPIGGVLATDGVVIPNAVGVDIGCGMCAVRTSAAGISVVDIKAIIGKVREAIPVGFKHHNKPQSSRIFEDAPDIKVIQDQLPSAKKQLGTLGGGNHFIELQKGDDGNLWLMIHSGSRNFGLQIARTYHDKAKALCEKWHSLLPNKDLAFLPISSPDADEYMYAMKYALEFAKASRSLMMDRFTDIVNYELGCVEEERFDVHHNFAAWENHFNKNVIVHRKGAISARAGQIGIVPGSQGTGSYIVEGLGNPESSNSCSHGAGRTMGRNQARKELDFEGQKKLLDDAGVVHSIRNEKDLDEAPGAYKDIDEVMKAQEDLVKIVVRLTPLGVIKG